VDRVAHLGIYERRDRSIGHQHTETTPSLDVPACGSRLGDGPAILDPDLDVTTIHAATMSKSADLAPDLPFGGPPT
jgi:hypothetical protein